MADSSATQTNFPPVDQLTKEQKGQVISVHNQLRREIQEFVHKIAELDVERNEHQLVIDTISTMDPKRRCFRLIGGVLVERTIEEVLPAVTKNHDGINSVLKTLSDQSLQKEKQFQEFVGHYGKVIKEARGATKLEESKKSTSSDKKGGGVLV